MNTAEWQAWNTLVKTMAEEGYGWWISLDSEGSEEGIASAWSINHPHDKWSTTAARNPVDALNILLRRCRRRWPKD